MELKVPTIQHIYVCTLIERLSNLNDCLVHHTYYIGFATDLTNLACCGKETYQTDTFGIGKSDLAVDGNTNQYYRNESCSHTISQNAIWEVDLGNVVVIDHVIIYNRLDCCSKFLLVYFICRMSLLDDEARLLGNQTACSNNDEAKTKTKQKKRPRSCCSCQKKKLSHESSM